MRDYNNHSYIDDLTPFSLCGKIIGFEGTVSEYRLPYPIKETYGEHDYKTCTNCSNSLEKIKRGLISQYKGSGDRLGFPMCCPSHAKLTVEVQDFKKEQFDSVAEISAHKIIYTYQHILNQNEKQNWKQEVSDYFEYAIESFGAMPVGCGSPLFLNNFFEIINELVNKNKDLNDEVITYVREYINEFRNKETFSIGILADTYSKWFTLFPFKLSFFAGIKEKYQNQLPLSVGPPRKNKYTGRTKGKLISVEELNTLLTSTTNKLITEINSYALFESGQLTDPEKIKLEVILESRRLKIDKGYLPDEKQLDYQVVLAEWLEDEKGFLNEITPFISIQEQKVNETKAEELGKKLNEFGFSEIERIEALTPQHQMTLIKSISRQGLPYCLAMLDFLGFIDYLLRNYFTTKNEMHAALAKCLNTDSRSVKGNINVLNLKSKEDRSRYTSHKFIETVKKDYENLK